MAWTAEFANDADFIDVLGGLFTAAGKSQRGHRTIFDTIYKGSHNRFEVEKVRLPCPTWLWVFVRGSLTWYLNGREQHIEARPTLVAERNSAGEWRRSSFSRNTLITREAVPHAGGQSLAKAHPYKGDTPVK